MDGVKCQSTLNFVLIQGEILLYDGKGLISNLDDINDYMAKKIQRYNNHFIIDELQASFIISEKPDILNTKNCGFISPLLMQSDIVLDIDLKVT
uniref:Uncharacterized protein n=1 Tax=Wuchereria bancrofti TaxID=6293 RepID=A0A1I8EXQ9_WUCBA